MGGVVTEASLVFIILWWVILFVILPIKLEMEDVPRKGCASGVPKNASLGIKVAITTSSSAILAVLYWYLKSRGYLNIDLEFLYRLVP